MILLFFFFPVALYLLVLGGINRRRYPLVVSGVWDFIGVLFAASGFLLFGGPAILSSMSERARNFWLLGKDGPGQATPEGSWQVWVFLSLLYFALVVLGSGYALWRSRALTSIYNVEPAVAQRCLHQVFDRLHLNPVRSGSLYLFGLAGEPAPATPGATHESIQAPHYLPGPLAKRLDAPPVVGDREFLGQTAVLEVESFPALRHVTLRWDPVDTLFRQEIETQLREVLSRTPAEESEVGVWMMLLSLGVMVLLLLGSILLVLLQRWSGGRD